MCCGPWGRAFDPGSLWPMDLLTTALRQGGCFSGAQAVAAGFTRRQIRYRVRVGAWREVQPDVFCAASTPVTPQLLERAALLVCGPGAALAAASAAVRWGLPGIALPAHPCVAVPTDRRPRLFAGTVRRRSPDVMRRSRLRDGVRVLAVEDTVRDLATTLSTPDLEALVTHVLGFARVTTAEGLLDACVPGQRGAAALRRAVAACDDEARSVWERRLAGLLTAAGIPPVMNHPVRTSDRRLQYLDLCYPEARLAIEVDGWSTHGNRVSFRSDRARKRRLVLDAGWYVIEVTPADIRDSPEEVVRMVLRFLARRASA